MLESEKRQQPHNCKFKNMNQLMKFGTPAGPLAVALLSYFQ